MQAECQKVPCQGIKGHGKHSKNLGILPHVKLPWNPKGKSYGTRQEAGYVGVFIVQQGNAVENGPKQGGKGGHSGSKDKCLDKTLKKATELGRGDKEAFCFT